MRPNSFFFAAELKSVGFLKLLGNTSPDLEVAVTDGCLSDLPNF